jgi:membrane fusion protein (multidrug efflux system)
MKALLKGALIVVVGIAVAWGLIAALRQVVRTDAKKARVFKAPIPVETAAATSTSLEEVIGASGEIQQLNTVTLSARISSRVVKVPVDIGSIVHEGELLAQWDDRVFQAALASAKENVEMTKAQLDHAAEQLRRMESLYQQGVGSAVDVETAKIDLASGRRNHAAAVEALTQAELEAEATQLRSPVTGVVLERLVNPEETTKRDQAVLKLGTLDSVVMVARVSDDKIGSVYIGQTAEVTYDAFPGERFTGEIIKIDPKADPTTRTFLAYIKLSNADLKLKPGLTGFARIYRTKQGVAVPSTSLMNAVKDRTTVFVVDKEHRAQIREVTPGVEAQGLTEIVTGLQPGDKVVTVGQLNLRENDEIHAGSQPSHEK